MYVNNFLAIHVYVKGNFVWLDFRDFQLFYQGQMSTRSCVLKQKAKIVMVDSSIATYCLIRRK
jgi:hypothetical protein